MLKKYDINRALENFCSVLHFSSVYFLTHYSKLYKSAVSYILYFLTGLKKKDIENH